MADQASDSKGGSGNPGITEEELSVAFEGPAVNASRVFVSLMPSGVRLSFVEQHQSTPLRFRGAFIVPLPVAISLKDVLTNQLADLEVQIKAATEAAEEKTDG